MGHERLARTKNTKCTTKTNRRGNRPYLNPCQGEEAQVAGVWGISARDRPRSAWSGLSLPIAIYDRVAGKKREEKSNSPPGLKFGFWLRKLFESREEH